MIWLLLGVGVLAGLFVLVLAVGLLLPRSHQASRSLRTAQAPESVWQVISDFAALPTWNPNVKAVERLPDCEGREVWRETFRNGWGMTLMVAASLRPQRLVSQVADPKVPFRGHWEFVLTPEAVGCRITITEVSEVSNPFIRFMARLFMNPAAQVEGYLKALALKLGDPILIEPGA